MASTRVHLTWLLTGVRQSSPGSTHAQLSLGLLGTHSMVYVYLATFVGFAPGIQGDKQGLINKSSQPPFFLEDIISRVL